jgi:ADP-dependent NAD(P)H-hydrate dehydratase / NAD(P)H-hydrate epimerase
MQVVSTLEMKELDRVSIEKFGIPSLILMENAGRGMAELACAILMAQGMKEVETGRVFVLAGKGNNGGDAFAAARHLKNRGVQVQILCVANDPSLKKDANVNFQITQKMKIPTRFVHSKEDLESVRKSIQEMDLVLDGLFGVGLTRKLDGLFKDVIRLVNETKKSVLAIDIPSGLNSDTGETLGIAIEAKYTGTLGAPKQGLYLKDGPKCSGEIAVIDISIPRELLSK